MQYISLIVSISLNFEIVEMLTSSTVSVPLILIGESSQRAIHFMTKLPRGQVLSPVFRYSDIITGPVYEHMTIEPVVVEKHNEENTLLVSQKVKTLKNI